MIHNLVSEFLYSSFFPGKTTTITGSWKEIMEVLYFNIFIFEIINFKLNEFFMINIDAYKYSLTMLSSLCYRNIQSVLLVCWSELDLYIKSAVPILLFLRLKKVFVNVQDIPKESTMIFFILIMTRNIENILLNTVNLMQTVNSCNTVFQLFISW